jgi:hypothetical protein
MLILKCTQKVAKELGVTLAQMAAEDNASLLGDWFVNTLKFGHTKTLLFVNGPTLYSMLVEYKKKDLSDMGQLFRTNLSLNLQKEGFEVGKIEGLLAEYKEVKLAKTDNRSVLGSMNDLAWLYQVQIEYKGGIKEIDLGSIIQDINRTPQLKRGGKYSIELMKNELQPLGSKRN